MDKSAEPSKITLLHGAVAGLGLLVFVLLFFADKTNLDNDRGAISTRGQAVKPELSQEKSLLDKIPPLTGLEGWDQVRMGLASSKGSPEEAEKLRETVVFLRDHGRLDAAAVYAARLADLEQEPRNWLVAGALAREAALGYGGENGNPEVFGAFVEQSLNYLPRAVEADSENEDALIELGLAYIGSGKPENSMQGIQQLLKVMELNPDNSEAAFQLGLFSRQTGQWEKAAQRFETVLRVDPQNHSARYFLALTYLDMGKTAEAKPLLNEIIKNSSEQELTDAARELLEKI
ncbi:MAG: tetratricopeptide repeat protein [Bacteroidia bacterium]|nr:tetratricopeptide repeat protein [Bacteroidia bacterium]